MASTRRFLAMTSILALLAGLLIATAATSAGADSSSIDFETFSLGSPDGQAGWQFTGPYDVAIADPGDYGIAGMGERALRISNAFTSGSFGDWAFSDDLADPAGEAASDGGGMTGSAREGRFDASFTIASAVPNAEQPGLQFSLAPDRGDGARMSFLRFNDTPGGIDVTFSDYVDAHAQGPASGCDAGDEFRTSVIAQGLDRSAPHTVRIVMDFLPGPANDRVAVYVDGSFVHAGTSWEDYFRYCEGNPTRPVDSLIFQARSGAGASPATQGDGFLIDDLQMVTGPTPANDTAGTWSSDVSYRTQVRPPINADGTSNFPKRRGVVPVQFDLFRHEDDGLLESIIETPNDPTNDFGFLTFLPSEPLSFYELDRLAADYEFLLGDCIGGSLRWSVGVDTDGNGAADGRIFVYYGGPANFTECTGANDGSGLNMIGTSEPRYDLSQLGGPFYGTYAQTLGLFGTDLVTRTSLVLDSGWATSAGQRVRATSASVNDETFVPAVTSETPFVKTCALPEAAIAWEKTDPIASGVINEADSIQPKDSGEFYRIVDCKYIYNLDVSSLEPSLSARAGTYKVWVSLDGELVPAPAKFDLK